MGILELLKTVYHWLHPVVRKTMLDDRGLLLAWKKQLTGFDNTTVQENKKFVLFYTFGDGLSIPLELTVAESFRQAGYDLIIANERNGYVKKAWQRAGIDQFPIMRDIQNRANHNKTKYKIKLSDFETMENVLALEENGVRIGKYAISSLIRKLRKSNLDFKDEESMYYLTKYLESSCEAANVAEIIMQEYRPHAIIMYDRGNTPFGQMFDLGLNAGIPVFTINHAHRNNKLMMKRYTSENRDIHPSSLSKRSWETLNLSWNAGKSQKVIQEISESYQSGEWYGEVGTQLNKVSKDAETLMTELNLNPRNKTAIIFPHIFWDATFFWGKDLFDNYEQWFVETVRNAVGNDRLNWIIKIHPGSLVKDQRDGYTGEHSEILAIRKHFGELPAHIKVLTADTKISTISLYEVADYCLTVRGTVGIEGACFGVTVLTAGTGRYDGNGFTVNSKTSEEYLEKVRNLELVPPIKKEQIELAQKFAYGVFLCRPTPLTSVKHEYLQDEKASLYTELLFQNAEELRRAEDVHSLKNWIESGDEDYLYEPNL